MRFVLASGAAPFAAMTAIAIGASSCDRAEPPTPAGSPSVASPEWPAAPDTLSSPPEPAASTRTAAVAPSPSATPTPRATDDDASLDQTHEIPAASGAAYDARVSGLWGAIVADDPAQAMPAFFPAPAYRKVKDVVDPQADWEHRLVAAYVRDIHALHARLQTEVGAGGATPALVDLHVPESARWVEPGEEWNKVGYFRVYGSKLRYRLGGESHAFDVKSLISWRGQWYVVHLSSIGSGKHRDAGAPHSSDSDQSSPPEHRL